MAHPDTVYLIHIIEILEKHLGIDESDARGRLEGDLYDVVCKALLAERTKQIPGSVK